eukprot:13673252-Alexandrium_andersonii.AAC.1
MRATAIAATPTVAMPAREPLAEGLGGAPMRAWRCGGAARDGSRRRRKEYRGMALEMQRRHLA